MNNFSVRLKKLRKKKGLSQVALGKKLGIGQTSIANYEAGTRIPSLEIFVALADIFNVSLDYLAGTIENNQKELKTTDIKMSSEGNLYLELLLKGNKNESINYIIKLKKQGWHSKAIYEKIFVPVLKKTGDLWESGLINVGEEHYISNTTLEIISQLYTIKPLKEKSIGKIFLSTVEQEEHMIGLKIMENILAQQGYDTYFLGNNTSSKHLLDSIQLHQPSIIILSITLNKFLINVEKTIHLIKNNISSQKVKIIIVGQGIKNQSEMVYRFGADGYGEDFDDVLNIIDQWTTR